MRDLGRIAVVFADLVGGILVEGHAVFGEQRIKLTRQGHFGDDVTTAHEFALDVKLGDGGPVGIILDALTDLVVGQHVHIGEIDAHEVQHACHTG